ncbi:GNAT family N-acetyltransferase [Clostridium baratii]|uniref:GNAT family N-acetyltransferase n=1 Tax=Clostridium baratii TaxID=1561 RepID=UPI0009A3BD0E|nr:GNAT family N-acetyltransferase [Clostridium baratii]OPF51311.1 acetyltransferase [Clostridium baratii]OPF55614.1 GNAT family N-acetyltransferase [Clostridium baratii]OPF57007.1 GNAT family N-acetyltransferase [Clostridium baratii]OPF60005.1 GNAT family N-acetyltransferase [Clostridium baratii]
MQNLIIKKFDNFNNIPYDLLLLADPSKESIDDYINRGMCYACYINNKLVGMYVLIKTSPFTLEIVNISVLNEFQGKGIGKKLLMHAINIAKKKNANILEIGTGNSSLYQLYLYQKCGFRITSIYKDFFKIHYDEPITENGIECLDMIKLSLILG